MTELNDSYRVTPVQVRDIFDTDLDDNQLTAWCNMANNLVEGRLAQTQLSESMLTDIEKNLAAHFASMDDPRAISGNIGNSSFTYAEAVKSGGFDSSRYGQTAKTIDFTGTLQSLEVDDNVKGARLLTF